MCCFFSIRLRSSLLSAVAFMLAGSLSAQGLTFDAALLAAAQRAPMLQARVASVQGSKALQASAAELPDPKLSVGIDSLPINGPDRGSLTRDNFTQRQIGWTHICGIGGSVCAVSYVGWVVYVKLNGGFGPQKPVNVKLTLSIGQ